MSNYFSPWETRKINSQIQLFYKIFYHLMSFQKIRVALLCNLNIAAVITKDDEIIHDFRFN